MGIWIRSQERNCLGKYVELTVAGKVIIGHTGITDTELGKYETEDRAMQVLEYAQGFILRGTRNDILRGAQRRTVDSVFQMPRK